LEQVKESFRQELAETEPLVAQLHDVIDQQRSLLSIRDTQSSELYSTPQYFVFS